MTTMPGETRIGERLPDIRFRTPEGGELALARLRGRPVVAVCVRYYG